MYDIKVHALSRLKNALHKKARFLSEKNYVYSVLKQQSRKAFIGA